MPNDAYVIELDTRDKRGGTMIRLAMYESYSEALKHWDRLSTDEDPDVWYWLVKIRDGIDDPAHIDCLEVKCRDGDPSEDPERKRPQRKWPCIG